MPTTRNSIVQNDQYLNKSNETLPSTTNNSVTSAVSNSTDVPSKVMRDSKGRLLPGSRLEGPRKFNESKQLIARIKREVELNLREQAAESLPYILQKAIDMAVKGDRAMIKLLLELSMSKPTPQDEDVSKDRDKVTINIRDLTLKPSSVEAKTTIEGQFEEVP